MATAGVADPRLAEIVSLILERRPLRGTCIIGVTGSVAVGKTAFAQSLAQALPGPAGRRGAEIVCTDGFLLPNRVLKERDLLFRKGFPETYDAPALRAALSAVRHRPADFPGYSHVRFDIDPALARRIGPLDFLIVEGLGLGRDRNHAVGVSQMMDVLIYLDAREADIEAWFTDRFVGFSEAARSDPHSFYARFSDLASDQVRAVASGVWRGINLPNLRQHIAPVMGLADIVARKGPGHKIESIELGPTRGVGVAGATTGELPVSVGGR